MSRTLYISDLDGTLLSPQSVITPSSAAIINGAIADGALFSVATARTPATLDAILRPLQINIPAVVMTGGVLWDRDANRYLQPQFLDPETASEVVGRYKALDFPSFIFGMKEGVLQVYHTGPLNDEERRFIDERRESPFKRFHIPADGNSALPVPLSEIMLLYAIQPNAPSAEAFDAVKEIPRTNPLTYHDIYGPETAIIEIFPETTSKSQGVRRLADMVGADRIVVFGDNINDLSMFAVADVAVAVGNALDAVKQRADIVIGPNSDDSVAQFIHDDYRQHRR